MDLYTWLSADSFVACLAIGSFRLTRRETVLLAAVFGVSDAGATLLGSMIPHAVPPLPDMVTYLVCALMLGLAVRQIRGLFYVLPVLLSLDNLFGGAPASLAPPLGLSCAVLALIGLSLAGVCRRVAFGRQSAF